jgi:hypothetical protein
MGLGLRCTRQPARAALTELTEAPARWDQTRIVSLSDGSRLAVSGPLVAPGASMRCAYLARGVPYLLDAQRYRDLAELRPTIDGLVVTPERARRADPCRELLGIAWRLPHLDEARQIVEASPRTLGVVHTFGPSAAKKLVFLGYSRRCPSCPMDFLEGAVGQGVSVRCVADPETVLPERPTEDEIRSCVASPAFSAPNPQGLPPDVLDPELLDAVFLVFRACATPTETARWDTVIARLQRHLGRHAIAERLQQATEYERSLWNLQLTHAHEAAPSTELPPGGAVACDALPAVYQGKCRERADQISKAQLLVRRLTTLATLLDAGRRCIDAVGPLDTAVLERRRRLVAALGGPPREPDQFHGSCSCPSEELVCNPEITPAPEHCAPP